MDQVIIAVVVLLAGFFLFKRFGGFLSSAQGKGSGCGHCGCSDKAQLGKRDTGTPEKK